jgi:hypothetical protein
MKDLIFTMSGSEVRNGGTDSYGFEHDILALTAGSFTRSKFRVNWSGDGTVAAFKLEQALWNWFIHILEGTRLLAFGMPSQADIRDWYLSRGTGGSKIPYLTIKGYDSNYGSGYGVSPDQEVEIQDVSIIHIFPYMSVDIVSCAFEKMPIYW